MNDTDRAKGLFFKGLACLENRDFYNSEQFFCETLKLAPRSIPTLNNLAIAQYQQGKTKQAALTAQKVLEIDPNNTDAYLTLSTCQKDQAFYDDIVETCRKIISIDPTIAEAHCNLGYALNKTKKYKEAIASFDYAIELNPQFADAFLNRGNALNNLKRHDEALAAYNMALAAKPNSAEAWLSRGNIFSELNRYDEAFAAYDKALSIKPDLAEAWLGRGNIFSELKRYDEAFAAYDKALSIKPDLAEAWLGRGNVFYDLKRYDEAIAAFDTALALKPDLENAWHGRGNVFYDLKRYDEAIAAFDKALALKPDLENAWHGRGNVFYDLKLYDEAIAAFDKALTLKPDFAEAWASRGNVFNCLKRYSEAFGAFDKAVLLSPDLTGLEGYRLYTKMHLCDWSNFDAERTHLISSVRDRKVNTEPFPFLAILSTPDDQLQCAKLWVAEKFPPSQKPIWRGERYTHDRIRIAYVSADFREHPVSHLMAGTFECHDKSRFDVTAISLGADDNSKMRQRLKASFERFIDAKTYSDDQIANLVKSSEVDVLVDLMGFTADARTNIFAQRSAPIQVNYLGYAGTMGASYIDYIVADQTVIPDELRKFYLEKIAFLPNNYLANDRKRVISDKAFTRSDVGLPSQGFVFCCFNSSYKISLHVFDSWMRILKQVEGSVLWLSKHNASATSNLKKEAVARGISSERLVFAEPMPLLAEHLARHKLADLFLDTLPYNAHTAASDALWAGLPVLTCIGETFSGRVAASLLNAIRLPQLITTTLEAYEQMAIDLATHPEKLAAVKNTLAENRLTTPLFDTKLFTKHIEAAYTMMYERHQAGLAPDHVNIPD
jgi:protein O-GlcNAc transferase